VAETPGALHLWEVGVEVREQGSVREVEQARGSIGHDVGLPWNEGEFGAVAVVSLMLTGALAEVGSGARGGGGSLEHAGQCGGVVCECPDGLFSHVKEGGDDVKLC
jgi:hypothetical protein